MDEEKLLKIVNSEFKDAMGAPGQELSNERAKAWDRYLSKPLGNEVEGESTIVTSDVSDVVDGIMPSLLRIFTTAENVVSFDAFGPEDMAGAQQESDYVNHVFFKENDSFLILFYWMFDALLLKNGIVMAWWDESEKVTTESYEGLLATDLPPLFEDPELEAISQKERQETIVGPDGEAAEVTVYDIEFRRVRKKGRAAVDNVPPDEYRISSDARSLNPNNARLVGRERLISRSDLVEMGFDPSQVADLPVEKNESQSAEVSARKDKTDDRNGDAQDKSQEQVRVREAYIKVDFDDDGRAELRQVFTSNDKILKWKDGTLANEPVDRQPFHVICSSPLPHKHFGRATAEKVIDVQDSSTTILRQVLMNLYHTNNPGHGVSERGMSENTLDDLLTSQIGRVVRFGGDPNSSYTQMTVPFTAGQSFPMLDYFDKVKRDRTGISSDGEGLNPEALKNIQTGVLSQSVDLSKMKIETIARIFAETGFKSLFLHIHELLLKHQDRQKVVQLRNTWVPVNPAEWRERDDMTVNIGLGIGTREQNLLYLNAIWEKQTAMVAGGGMNLTVTPQNIYNTAAELVKNANLKNPAMFFTDPGNQMAPPPADEADQLKQMEMQLEERRQQLDAQRFEIQQQKVQLDTQRLTLQHEREVAKIQQAEEERLDKFQIENEKLRNQLAEMQIRVGQAQVKAPLDAAKTKAETDKLNAETGEILSER